MWSRSSNMSDDFLIDFARLRVHTMGDPLLLCAILLLILNQEVSGDVKEEHVLTGKDVHLHIQRPELIRGAFELKWIFNTKINVLKYTFRDQTHFTFPNYQGRVTFNVGNSSLLLKNLTKRDSGLYAAITTKDEDKTIYTVNLTVQDAVSPVHLTVVSELPGLHFCNVTVNCSSQDSSVTHTFTCDNQSCSREGGESSELTTSTGLISINVSEGSLICNHSNQVSWRNNTREIKQLCLKSVLDGRSYKRHQIHIGILSVVGCICGIAAIAIGIYLQRRWRTQRTWDAAIDVPNTTYDSVQFQNSDPAMTNPDAANGQQPEHGDTSLTIYSLLQHPPGFVPTTTTETSNTTPTNTESLYAQVQKPDRR